MEVKYNQSVEQNNMTCDITKHIVNKVMSYPITAELFLIAKDVREGKVEYDDVFWNTPDDDGSLDEVLKKCNERAKGGDFCYTTSGILSINVSHKLTAMGFFVGAVRSDENTCVSWG